MLMTVLEVADYLQLSDKTVLRLANSGEIPCLKIARQWRFPKQALDEWIGNKIKEAASDAATGEKKIK